MVIYDAVLMMIILMYQVHAIGRDTICPTTIFMKL